MLTTDYRFQAEVGTPAERRESGLAPPAPSAAASTWGRPRLCEQRKRVMVVEDDPGIREVTAAWLEDEGFSVTTANNGAEALRKLADARPDAIVLDLMMPIMDGWAFAEACHQASRPSEVPIVVVSAAHGLAQAAEKLRGFGVRACVAKPFDLDLLAATVSTLVERRETHTVIGAAS